MPRESLNVYLTAVDKMSPVLASITDKTKALDKESQELQQTFEALQKANKGLIDRKTELQKKLQEINEEVKEARESFKALGDEASADAYAKAQEKQQKLRNEIAATTKALSENQKIYKENIETIRKGDMGAGGSGISGLSQLGTIVAGMGVWNQVSSLVQSGASAFFESSLGSATGGIASGALSNAVSGAVLGNTIAPGIGTAVGAALGGALGALGGGLEQWGSWDEAFKDYYGGLYDDVKGRSGEMVESGSAIAGGREQTRMAFSQRLGGDDEAAAYLARVEKMAASTNYEYDEITGYTKLLLNSYAPDEVFGVLQKLSDATAGLDLSSSDVNMMISGLSRMRTTGKATQEYLNYFRERGVDVDQALANSLNVDKGSIADMVSKGKIGGEDAAEAILDFIQDKFGGLSDILAGTYDAMVDNLGDMEASLKAAGGDAYNTLRKEGINEQMLAYGGELGDAIKEINAVMGENQARRENLQAQYIREAVDVVLRGSQGTVFNEEESGELAARAGAYADWKAKYEESGETDAEAAANMERLYEEAQSLGQAYYDNSDFVQILNDTELTEIEAIQQATAGLENAYSALYDLNQTMSKGLVVKGGGLLGGLFASGTDESENTLASWRADPGSVTGSQVAAAQSAQADAMAAARRNAFGLDRVPYDDYPALLHEGERVLTAAEARAQDAVTGPPIALNITGNSFTGTSEEMADQLWEIIMRKLEQAYTAAAPK